MKEQKPSAFHPGTIDRPVEPGHMIDVWADEWSLSDVAGNTAESWLDIDAGVDHDLSLVIGVIDDDACVWLPGHGHLWLMRRRLV